MKWTELFERSYVPYSGVPVACVIEAENGTFYPAVRVENISFPLTISALQAACCICLAEGAKPAKVYLHPQHLPEQLSYWLEEFGMDPIYTEECPLSDDHNYAETGTEISDLDVLLDKAVTPHSDFPVACLIKDENGRVYSGVNVEVGEWTKGLCAERVALCKAVFDGAALREARMIIRTRKGEVSSPCGACRQVLGEHCRNGVLRLDHADGTHSRHQTVDLIPFHFKSKALSKDLE